MANTFDGLIAGLQSYIVAPLNAFGLGGLVFDIPGDARAQLGTDITDHYTENNRALQDHIAIKPKRITLKGYVGELIYNQTEGSTSSTVQQVTQKLTVVSSFLPKLSAAAQQAQQLLADPLTSDITLNSVEGALPAAADIYGLVKNMLGAFGDMANQQNAYNYFDACRQQAVLMGIQTPWEFLTNMAVETIEAIQSEDSISMTDFSITFKQIRIATTEIALTPLAGTGGALPPGGVVSTGAAAQQSASIVSQGVVPGMTLPTPVLSGLGAVSKIGSAADFHALSGVGNLFSFGG